MVNETTISMRELELESAQLLPSRETLCVSQMQWWGPHRFHRGFFGGFGFGEPVGFGFGGFGFPVGFGGFGGGCGCGW
jgi:hypothetical protein